jgi:phage terminase large subunit-like protein
VEVASVKGQASRCSCVWWVAAATKPSSSTAETAATTEMSVLSVPELEAKPWPTLGPQICQFIEAHLVHGPGDLRGEPARLDDEKRGLIYRMYEVFPKGHEQAGRRRFKRVAISLRKGSAKTELAAWIAICELHPDGPVRCDGFDKKGLPIGRGVTDPYIPMVAFTEEQVEELCYGAVRVILENCALGNDFDIGLERIIRKGGDGKCVPLATSPNATDGARTSFQIFDETHRMALPRLKAAHRTMQANLPKRLRADPWSLETTTAYAPGEGSIAEDTMQYARQIAEGKIEDPRLFFFHRQASDNHDLTTKAGLTAAVREASGPVASWSDIGTIVEQWQDPTADPAYLERVWLNRLVQSSEKAFDVMRWQALAQPGRVVPKGTAIVLGFDGARFYDSTALIGTEVESGFQFVLGVWERPELVKEWEVPKDEVDAAVAHAFDRYRVIRFYADPPYWEETVASWIGTFGKDRVSEWWTNRAKVMGYAVRAFRNALIEGSLSHSGDAGLARHVGNAHKRVLGVRDEQGEPLWTVQKERPDSVFKIDAAVAAVLSWEARTDAIAAGALSPPPQYQVMVMRR